MTAILVRQPNATGALHIRQIMGIVPRAMATWQMLPVQLPEEGFHGQVNLHVPHAIPMLQVSVRGLLYTGNHRDTGACTAAPVMGVLMQCTLPVKHLIITSQNNTRDLHLLLKLSAVAEFAMTHQEEKVISVNLQKFMAEQTPRK